MQIHSIKLTSGEIITIGDEVVFYNQEKDRLEVDVLTTFIFDEGGGDTFMVKASEEDEGKIFRDRIAVHHLYGTKETIKKLLK